MLTVIGGTYWEFCEEPEYDELWGSGLRGACALAEKGFEIDFYSCVSKEDLPTAMRTCNAFDIKPHFIEIAETVTWEYYHPLSSPQVFPAVSAMVKVTLPKVANNVILYYGMIEAHVEVTADYLVYDPQNGVPYSECGASAKHLALVLNKKEALKLSGLVEKDNLLSIGNTLRSQTGAEVVIIKNGSDGGVVVSDDAPYFFPIYDTSRIWPIGSGDIFSAAFCWKWGMAHLSPADAAHEASLLTAYYCETRLYPLPNTLPTYNPVKQKIKAHKVYLAGPFFNIAERWLINELRYAILDFGNEVFSPWHDVGLVDNVDSQNSSKEIATKDLAALDEADVVLAVANGTDVGTIFEVGYAIAKNKRVVVLVENINDNDLTMLVGSDCILTKDIATAAYKASW